MSVRLHSMVKAFSSVKILLILSQLLVISGDWSYLELCWSSHLCHDGITHPNQFCFNKI